MGTLTAIYQPRYYRPFGEDGPWLENPRVEITMAELKIGNQPYTAAIQDGTQIVVAGNAPTPADAAVLAVTAYHQAKTAIAEAAATIPPAQTADMTKSP